MQRGWELTKQSWAIVRADGSLALFPVIGTLASLLAAIVFFGAGAGLFAATGSGWAAAPLVLLGLYALTAISIFAGVALTACAAQALDGQPTTVAFGIAAARERIAVILAWAAVQLVVGALISLVQSLVREGAGQLVGSLVGGLANLAWSVATFFVVPSIALEGLGPREALKRSSGVIRQHWGEGATGAFAISGIVMLLGFLPAALLIALGVAAAGSVPVLAVLLIALGVGVLIAAALISTTVSAVFKTALYRYATSGVVSGGFAQQTLEQAFVAKRPRGSFLGPLGGRI